MFFMVSSLFRALILVHMWTRLGSLILSSTGACGKSFTPFTRQSVLCALKGSLYCENFHVDDFVFLLFLDLDSLSSEPMFDRFRSFRRMRPRGPGLHKECGSRSHQSCIFFVRMQPSHFEHNHCQEIRYCIAHD